MSDTDNTARRMWTLYEPYHAVVYFAPQVDVALKEAGYKGFWMGYFAARLAPIGAVGPELGAAVCFGFEPAMVTRSLPDAWRFAPPVAALDARLAGVGAVLDELGVTDDDDIAEAADLAVRAAASIDRAGRVLGAANAALPVPDSPRLALWQATTTLREHRGDGHVAALTASGLGACPTQVLAVAAGSQRQLLQPSRGWSDDDWSAALSELFGKGWLAADGTITSTGREVHGEIEARTDASAAGPWRTLGTAGTARLAALLAPPAERIAGRVVPYPNPIGVPPPS
ncbi:MAG: hypothetical protein QOJ67_4043 [Acidimicrobiaceae bacterium]|jgi:hypothetical protein